MTSTPRAPKQWKLTKDETINSFESWRQNLLYSFSQEKIFAPFLETTWQKKTATNPHRGLQDDGSSVPEAKRLTATQKNTHLELLLGQIANFCPIVSRSSIIKNSVSLNDVWQKIRLHYGFQSTGAHFLDLSNIHLSPDERPEDLYQRLMALFEDNLLTVGGAISHQGETISTDEDLTPTLENTIVFLWLQLINPGLPQLVKQKYGSELRNKSLASLKPEISQALSSLLDELRSIEDSKAMRVGNTLSPRQSPFPGTGYARPRRYVSCILCKTAGRPHTTHSLVDCRFVPQRDRRLLASSRLVCDDPEECDPIDYSASEEVCDLLVGPTPTQPTAPSAQRVRIVQSPVLSTFYESHPVPLTLDMGATSNMIRESSARLFGFPITPASQMARQADGVTPMDVTGEVHCTLTRGDKSFELDALVVRQLDVDILAGNPFMVRNDIAVRPAHRKIIIGGSDVVHYGMTSRHIPQPTARRTQAFLLRCPEHTVVFPGEYIQLDTPIESDPDAVRALEPRLDSPSNLHLKPASAWPRLQNISSVDHAVRVPNTTNSPILLKKGEQLCQIRPIVNADSMVSCATSATSPAPSSQRARKPFSKNVTVDPGHYLPDTIRNQFHSLHLEYDDVFNPAVSKYNGASGKIEAFVNIGPTLPPQRKGRLPQYNRSTLEELQDKFDELESAGVFAKPEQVNVQVEYLNTSFLVKKPNGGSRLVTAFGEVAQYCKPQPSLMPNVDSVLRDIGKWNYLIITDLLKSFYQIPLAHSSMKFCGVATPFKGIRVYTRSAMGMPGSETCLEELMSRVLGELIQEGCVAKIADDLYVGGISFEDALQNWQRVLEALKRNNLRLSTSKTIVCPRTATILGWIWSNGTLQASPHKLATLSSVAPPSTVQGLRSFVGSYKVLSRVLPRYADLLDPLDQAIAGKESREKIIWTDDLTLAFQTAQKALRNHKSISIPRPSDSLWIVTDGSVKNRGIAATMYIHRNGKLLLAGFFNAKLRKHQVTWLPCEIEALAIGAAIKHFSPYIILSPHTTQLLTDSRPCVQAYDKLKRGEFSTSSRVTTFLSTVSRYLVHVRHIAGIDNLPSDFTSRNPIECRNSSCQICKFIAELEDSVVRTTTVDAVLEGSVHMPFTSRAAWQATQQDCSDLRRTHAHLSQGTRPSKKETNLRDIKRYLKDVIIAADGLLVVRDSQPFQPIRERIVVPRSVLSGLLTALHIRFHHPSKYQTKRLFNRYFFAFDTDKAIETLTSSCHHCQSLKAIPRHLQPQSSSDPPATIGVSFAADIVKRYRQLILVLRETVSSYTLTSLIESEKREHLRDGLLILSVGLRSLCDHGVTIRVDPAPGFSALHNDKDLLSHGIKLELGHAKNPNKNPVAERAVEELGLELLNISPEGGPISRVTLALATANLNSRIRRDGLSACELWTQRDQLTGEQLPIVDRQVILNQHRSRLQNHPSSSVSKAGGKPRLPHPTVSVGTLVFLVCDKSKLAAREKYLIVGLTDSNTCQLRKFTSSQFRSKVYTVPISQCFPVSPTMLAQDPQGPIRGLNEPPDSDSDDDPDPLDPTSETTLPTPPPIPDAITPRQPDPEAPSPTAPEQPRRSTRPVRPPSWRTSDYVYD